MKYLIPFNRPYFTGNEQNYIAEAFANGHISGDGSFTDRCHSLIEEILGVEKVLLTTSCTHALEMTGLLLDLKSGDEVIVPSFTFVSTVNAFVLQKTKVVFIDVRPDTLNMDETLLESMISPHTKAIIPVHYAGVGCEMDAISDIADKHNICVIEDNARGFLGSYKNKYLGTFGEFATVSFHETKNISCGEGGVLIINDSRYIERAEIIREKGTNRKQFFRGQVEKYTWVDVGSSYVLSDILAAILFAQLENREQILNKRRRIWEYYYEYLSGWAKKNNVRLPIIPTYCKQSYHMFYLLMPSCNLRQKLINHLKSKGILSVFHYQPLHLSEMGKKFGGKKGDCPVTEDVSERLLRLPFYNNLEEKDLARIIDAIMDFHF